MRRCFFYHTDLGQKAVSFTILRDKLHSHSVFRTMGARASLAQEIIESSDQIIKRFHEENSIMSGLFSQNNLLLHFFAG